MTTYNVRHADAGAPTINIDEQQINQSTDITLFGRRRLQYGEQMNQNMLHLLENFSLPEQGATLSGLNSDAVPDLSLAAIDQTSGLPFLSNPTLGQIWFNETQDCLFFYNGTKWQPISMYEDIAANWGIIYDGQTLPKPVSSTTGHVFDYDECVWIISPYQYPQELEYMLCRTDVGANVTSIYSVVGNPAIVSAFATYFIVGIRGNENLGTLAPVPSATPTPTHSATVTPSRTRTPVGGTPTSTPTSVAPTPTPTPSLAYAGPLALFAFNPDGYNGRYDGQVHGPHGEADWFPGDGHAIKYPGVKTIHFNVNYTSDGAPRNPWDSASGEYYVYIDLLDTLGVNNFLSQAQNYKRTMLFSNDGTNGLFYKIKSATALGGTMVALNIDSSSGGSRGSSLFNRPPQQSGPLAFNFQYGYLVQTYINTFEPANGTVCQITSPSPYQQGFDLYITGGKPPYTITDIRAPGGNFPVWAIASGMTGGSIPRTNFQDITDVAASFIGPVTLSNPNVSVVPNGYRFANFLTADLHYPYPPPTGEGFLAGCPPEYLWNYCYSYPPVYADNPCALTEQGCSNYSGYQTDSTVAYVTVEVTDNLGTVITAPLLANWQFQTVDYKFPNTNMGFSGTWCGRAAGNTITTSGTYFWNGLLTFVNDPTATEPVDTPAQLKYVFSIVKPTTSTNAGDWTVSPTDANKLSTFISGGCYSSTADNSKGLVHISDDSTWGSGGHPLTPWNGTTGNIQAISLLSYVNTSGSVVNISGTPIVVRLYPYTGSNLQPSCEAPGANTFTWNALKADGTNNNSNWTTPQVPYDLVLDVTIPSGVTQPGSLTIPIITWAYEHGTNCFGFGQSGNLSLVQLNFAL